MFQSNYFNLVNQPVSCDPSSWVVENFNKLSLYWVAKYASVCKASTIA